jgi:hypothetical protein
LLLYVRPYAVCTLASVVLMAVVGAMARSDPAGEADL